MIEKSVSIRQVNIYNNKPQLINIKYHNLKSANIKYKITKPKNTMNGEHTFKLSNYGANLQPHYWLQKKLLLDDYANL